MVRVHPGLQLFLSREACCRSSLTITLIRVCFWYLYFAFANNLFLVQRPRKPFSFQKPTGLFVSRSYGRLFPVENKLPWPSTSGHLFEVNQVKGILKISIPSRVFVTKTDKKTTRTVGLSHPLDVHCTHVGVAGSSLEIKSYSLFPY